jgi:hypothetical protein
MVVALEIVTAPLFASALPLNVPPFKVIEAVAKIFPIKVFAPANVAELPTRNTTLSTVAPPVKVTIEPAATVRVEAVLMTYVPAPLRVRVPPFRVAAPLAKL